MGSSGTPKSTSIRELSRRTLRTGKSNRRRQERGDARGDSPRGFGDYHVPDMYPEKSINDAVSYPTIANGGTKSGGCVGGILF